MSVLRYEIAINDRIIQDDRLYGNIQEISVEDSSDSAGTFTIRVVATKDSDGSWKYAGKDLFHLFDKVRISAGFPNGNKEHLVEGYITNLSFHIDKSEEKSFFDVSGMDMTILMNLREKLKSWVGKTDSEIAKEIFSKYGFKAVVDDSSPSSDPDFTVVQRSTDIEFLKNLAYRNGFECFVRKDFSSDTISGYFGKPRPDITPQKDIAAYFAGNTNLINIDFSVDGLRPLSVEVRQKDPYGGEVHETKIDSSQIEKIGKQNLSDLVKTKVGGLIPGEMLIPNIILSRKSTSESQFMQSIAQSVFDEGSWFITARGSIDGLMYGALLRSNLPVLIKGVGDDFSGKYYVSRVVHKITSDSYIQEFEAKRNAIGLTGSENFQSS